MSSTASLYKHLSVLLIAKVTAGCALLIAGFVAISDDDYARIVLAQQWASQPQLDPTQSSWLPLPFWIYGSVMRVFAPTLGCARITAFALGILATVAIYFAARNLCSKQASLIAAGLAAVLPWSARLGVSAVPELPTAALCLFGISSLCVDKAKTRLLGATALGAACLCRYESWPLAAMFFFYTFVDLWRSIKDPAHPLHANRNSLLVALLVVATPPLSWLLYQKLHHGNALHFAHRVSAYHKAVASSDAFASLLAYPFALFREEPELCIASALLSLGYLRCFNKSDVRWRVVICCSGLLLLLMAAAFRGGAPTHHSGRPLLTLWLALCMLCGELLVRTVQTKRWGRLAVASGLAVLLLSGTLVLRPWYARMDAFSPRRAERAVGRALRQHIKPGECVLLEVHDFGYYATLAASGQPDAFVLDRRVDPRHQRQSNSFSTKTALQAKARRCAWVIAKSTAARELLGKAIFQAQDWKLYAGLKAPLNSR